MIKVIHYQNKSSEEPVESIISDGYDEVRKLLPRLPETIQIYFSDYGILPDSGVGGYAYAHDIITISIDPDFADKKKQAKEVRSTVFHESFHILQNFTGESGPFSAIQNAVYEGMATVFEREYCDIWQPYGDYRETSEEKLKEWTESIQNLSLEEFENSYSDWKFFHPKLQERWIMYKVGTWIIDQVLHEHKLTILDLSTKTADEVLDIFNLANTHP